jgi:hypothetical protein
MKIIECEQRSPEWYAARAGIPTASEFKTVLAERGRTKGSESEARRKYILRLAGERITGEPATSYENAAMARGREMEPQAREDYAFIHDVEPELVGFVTLDDGSAGASPDSFIGANGMLEIKTAEPHILLAAMRSGGFPPEHKAQCQGNLWVCEREWIDLCIYWPRMKPLVLRAHRDEAYIGDLATAVAAFNEEVAETVEWYRRYGEPDRLRSDLKASLEVA